MVVARDARQVIEQLRDATTWPDWQPEIVAAVGPSRIAEGDEVEGRARMLGFVVEGRSHAIEVGDDVLEEDVVVGVRMRVRYEIEQDPAGTKITRRLTAGLPGGPAGRLLSVFLKVRLKRMQTKVLRALQSADPSP